ncbi:class E sortase [Streptomyces sp. NPDC046203]|uniref:class E sortase n=1 Tax=Streptomyces sp. NPDC046203 TaxID=3154602 RepID=UPI0033E597F5
MRARVRGRVPVVLQARRRRPCAVRVLRAAAETLVTCGLVVLLFVVHQLWWTNRQAQAWAQGQVRHLEEGWGVAPTVVATAVPTPVAVPTAVVDGHMPDPDPGSGRDADSGGGLEPGSGSDFGSGSATPYAVLRIPRLHLAAPIAPGTDKHRVLDQGYVGQYPGSAAPGRTGNLALAGHRNTHGEPFRRLDRLRPGDDVTVRTRQGTYTYRVDRVLARTSPRDTGVIAPVPRSLTHPAAGYDRPGAYLTLTTCTPEFSSAYRLVVWAKLISSE